MLVRITSELDQLIILVLRQRIEDFFKDSKTWRSTHEIPSEDGLIISRRAKSNAI